MIKKILAPAFLYAALLVPAAYAEEALDPDTLFNNAMRFRQDGELFKSIEIFETILNNQPELNRARLELAVSYHLTRRYEDAKEQLNLVFNDPETPEKVKLAISSYLAQLSSDMRTVNQRTTSSIYLSAGMFTDSNINLGPGKDIRDTNPNLSDDSIKNSGSGGQFMLSYSHRSRAGQAMHIAGSIADFEWLTQATAYSKVHGSGDSEFNLSVLTLNTGPALITEKSWRAAFNIKLDKLIFGKDDYAQYVTINPLFTYSFNPDLEITFENATTAREYDQTDDQGLTGTMTSWSIDLAKFYARQSIGIQVGVKYHDNGAKEGSLHYTGAEFYLGGQMPAWDDALAYLTLSNRDYRYMSIDVANGYTDKRDETEFMAVLGFSHDFRYGILRSWTLNAQYTLTNNDSNISEFEYDRNVYEVNLRRYFF